MARRIYIALALAAFVLQTGCISTQVIDANSTPAIKSDEAIPEDQLLDVGIMIFAAGLKPNPEYNKTRFIDPEVRKAEGAYLPYTLRNTLEETENWGAVRILPKATDAIDLLVEGEIIVSNGEELKIEVRVSDASGTEWFERKYADVASSLSYREEIGGEEDPFQDLFNRIADDMLAARREFSADQIKRIRTIARMKFAGDVAPHAFEGYIDTDRKGRHEVVRLPSDDDPMLARVEKIRDREYMFIDLLDENYRDFHGKMSQPYEDWRRYTYEEVIALRELKRSAMAAKLMGAAVVVGGAVIANKADTQEESLAGSAGVLTGAAIVKAGFDLSAQSKIHAEALHELGDSFANEVQPLVVEVEGRTVTLTGTAESQFEQWRELLREIYESETGLDVSDEDSDLPEVHRPDQF